MKIFKMSLQFPITSRFNFSDSKPNLLFNQNTLLLKYKKRNIVLETLKQKIDMHKHTCLEYPALNCHSQVTYLMETLSKYGVPA